jgi:cellulose synthase/poly-beta-1,6-N-acetylglucosamine synthase-like glycosyltransferase
MQIIAIIYLISMGIILLYSISQLQLVYNFIKYKRQEKKRLAQQQTSKIQNGNYELPKDYFPFITVQLPIYNEMYVVERLLDAIFGLVYPTERFEVQILDDSTDETQLIIANKLQQLALKYPNISYTYIHRTDRTGFKAGALENATRSAKGEFIAIFDADFNPESQFLLKVIPYFQHDNQLAAVQTRWAHINEHESLLTEIQSFMLDAHFSVEQFARSRGGFFINFNGTAGIWRKVAIHDAGGWEFDSITEDLDLSYRAQLKGWKIHYDDSVSCPAEIPAAIQAVKSQQFRWTKGAAEVAKKHLKSVWQSKNSLGLKYQATAHLLNSGVFFAIIISSILSIWVNYAIYTQQIGYSYQLARDLMGGVFYIVLLFFSVSFYYKNHLSFGSIVYFLIRFPLFLSATYGLSLHNSWAAMQGYWGIKTEFVRTAKFNQHNRLQPNKYLKKGLNYLLIGEILLCIYFAIGVYLDILWRTYDILPFHCLLCLGYFYMIGLQIKDFIQQKG